MARARRDPAAGAAVGPGLWSAGAVVIGCRENTFEFIDTLLRRECPIAGIVTIPQELAARHDVPSWVDLSMEFGNRVPVYIATSYRLDSALDVASLSSCRADVGFCIGWQRLLPRWFLDRHRNGVFGMHATATLLPDGRGRSPINWSLIEGADHLQAHILRYEDEPDGGPLLSVTTIRIAAHDDIQTLQQKARVVFTGQVARLWDDLVSGTVCLEPLRTPRAEDRFYPKRSPDDGVIDWSWPAARITDWVRAQTRPYPGAFTHLEGHRYAVWRCGPAGVARVDPAGTVLATFRDGKCIVTCGDNQSLHLLDHDLPPSLRPGQRLGSDAGS